MIPEDLAQYQILFPVWKKEVGPISSIALLSPHTAQLYYLTSLFPLATIDVMVEQTWDLNCEANNRTWDLIVAMNVLHYSKKPQLWFDNVLNACQWFWLQDLVNRRRGGDVGELGSDGDSMRYCRKPDVVSDFEGAYDLGQLGDKLVHLDTYKGGVNVKYPPTHFIACVKGDQ